MTMDYLNSDIIIVDETHDGYGYICSRHNDIIYAHFWASGRDSIKVSFHSQEYMYNKAKEFSMSGLRDYSPLHIAKDLMFQAYINWYEEQYST
jgi:hypothetical protein